MDKMNISDFKNKQIGIFGFGTEGQSLLRYFSRHQIKNILVFDEGKLDKARAQLIKKAKASLIEGPFEKKDCARVEIAFRSPGLKREKIEAVLSPGCQLTSQTNLFFALHKGKVVAVTGTKGKSTTVGLIDKILKISKKNHFVGGNIGNAPIEFVDQTTAESISVLELSSFQLEDLKFAPDIAVVLPLYIDHLDYHSSQGQTANYHENEENYLKAKAQIAKNMDKSDILIVYGDEKGEKLANSTSAEKLFYSPKKIQVGCFMEGNSFVCQTGKRSADFKDVISFSSQAKIPLVNTMAALAFAFSQNLNFKIEDIFSGFEKLPYRIQLVNAGGGLNFYNDSASTNPISTIEAMKTMTQRYILIMGGSSKDLSYDVLARAAVSDEKIIKVYLLGQTADEIEDELKLADFDREIIRKETLDEVMEDIKASHKPAGAVLFSPASASFDSYENYKKRGEHFTGLVKKLF